MAAIDELIEQIDNPTLRERISAEVQRMVKQKKFGLVFEEHLPERTLLHEIPVQRGSLVARNGNAKDVYQVVEIDGEKAKCFSKADREQVELPVSELTCVAEFGEPIYPYLEPLDSVENAPDSGLWHTLIEADNYHALQLLDYMYHGKVDCIYIDPNVIKIRLGYLQPFENRGIKNMHNTSRNEKMAWQTGGTGPPKKNI